METIGRLQPANPTNHQQLRNACAHWDQMIATVIDMLSWLEADSAQPLAERLHRDRRLAGNIRSNDPLGRALAWWKLMSVESAGRESVGVRWARQFRRVSVALFTAGIVAGGSTMSGVAVIEQDRPVNLLFLVALFLLLPMIGWILSVLAMAFGNRSEGARRTGIFGMDGLVNRWLGRSTGLASTVGAWPARATSEVVGGHLLLLSQWFTLGFLAGALLALGTLVVFTDLAFGWSTTIELTADSIHTACLWLAFPWAGWLPSAVPDASLVEASRFFRLEDRGLDRAAATNLGQWWPFVGMCILVWGLFPRILLVAWIAMRLRSACRRLLFVHPEVPALLERLQAPLVGVTASEVRDDPADSPGRAVRGPAKSDRAHHPTLIWNDCLAATTAGPLPFQGTDLQGTNHQQANLRQTDAEWEKLARSLAGAGSSGIQLLVAGWEPPMFSLRDFLLVLRKHVPARQKTVLVPVNIAGTGVDATDHLVWENTVAGWSIDGISVASEWERP